MDAGAYPTVNRDIYERCLQMSEFDLAQSRKTADAPR